MIVRLTFKGQPISKARPRVTKRGAYCAQSKEMSAVRWEAEHQYSGDIHQGAVAISMKAYFTRPKGHFGTGRNAGKLKPSAPQHHVVKPDGDNIEKFYWDCLSGILYVDDSQIVSNSCQKIWLNEQNAAGYVDVTLSFY